MTPGPLFVASDKLAERRSQVDSARSIIATHCQRVLPPLLTSAPQELIDAWRDYGEAIHDLQEAELSLATADEGLAQAAVAEGREIQRRIKAGENGDSMIDYAAEADRKHRWCAQVVLTQSGKLREAAGRLITLAVKHRDEQLRTFDQPLTQAKQHAAEALAEYQRRQRRLSRLADLAAWWTVLQPTHFPSVGQTNAPSLDEIVGAADSTLVHVGTEDDAPAHLRK
jgi:hypothetical protein